MFELNCFNVMIHSETLKAFLTSKLFCNAPLPIQCCQGPFVSWRSCNEFWHFEEHF